MRVSAARRQAITALTVGYLSTRIQSVEDELRAEMGAVRNELREEIADNRAAIADLAQGPARIKAIFEDR